MSRPHLPGLRAPRTRWAAAGITAAATVLTTAGLVVPSAQSAPSSACPAPYPENQLTRGQSLNGLTVSGATSATTPEPFTGTVIGVLQDGIAPGMDLIMTRLSSPEIDRVGGIWQGMSGSPVYATDGRLVGAVAYGLSYGPSPVAGLTPAADMEALLHHAKARTAKGSTRAAIPTRIAHALVTSGSATRREVGGGMTQLRLPFGVSGLVGSKRLRQAGHLLGLRNVRMMHGDAVGPNAATTPIVPGGNLAASLSYGDVTAAGIGTATTVCGAQVLAFGHPMNFTGPSTMTLHGAEALYVQEDPYAPFKVANITGPAGSITQDRLAGLRGRLGSPPSTTPITSYVRSAGRSRTGTTWMTVQRAVPDLATMHLLADQDRVLDGVGPGSGQASWDVRGLRHDGTPFRLVRSDLYADPYDISGAVAFTLYDTLSRLQANGADDISFQQIQTRSQLDLRYQHYLLGPVQVQRAGRWETARAHRILRLPAGATAALRVRLDSPTLPSRWLRMSLPVPTSALGQFGSLDVVGGNSISGGDNGEGGAGTSLDAVLRQLRRAPHHNEVLARLSLGTGKGQPPSSAHVTARHVVDGSVSYQVRGVR